MGEDPDPQGSAHRAGRRALTFGLLAAACSLIPVIGDVAAVPTAVIAIVFGVIGAGHYDAGRAPRIFPSVAGAVLGAGSLLITVISLIASHPPG